MRQHPRRVDGLSVFVAGLTALAIGASLGRALAPTRANGELVETWPVDMRATWEARFNGQRHSLGVEEWIARDFFGDRREGIFLDVGANHHERGSNTYYLETVLGWSGLAIDALPEFAEGYRAARPRTIFVPAFVSDADDQRATFYVPGRDDTMLASSDRHFTESLTSVADVREVPTVTLDTILERHELRAVDFLSLDIELHELEALRGFNLAAHRPALICVESHFPIRQRLIDHFFQHGYVVVGRYLRIDPDNLYFAPQGTVEDTQADAPMPTHAR